MKPRLNAAQKRALRDKFAMAALTGILADPKDQRQAWSDYAGAAYEIADAMLKARDS